MPRTVEAIDAEAQHLAQEAQLPPLRRGWLRHSNLL